MTNQYFDVPNWTRLARLTTGRAENVDSIFDAVVAGFALLPTPLDLKNGSAFFVGTDTGSVNAYVLTTAYAQASYTDGMAIVFRAATTNTGDSTININGIGVIGLKDYAGNALTAGAIIAGGFTAGRYDSINNIIRVTGAATITNNGTINITNVVPAYGVATGTDAYSVTTNPFFNALTDGQTVRAKFPNANTGAACTLNANGTGAKPVVHIDGSAMTQGDIPANGDQTLIYDTNSGGQWQLLGPIVNVTGLMLLAELMAGD